MNLYKSNQKFTTNTQQFTTYHHLLNTNYVKMKNLCDKLSPPHDLLAFRITLSSNNHQHILDADQKLEVEATKDEGP